MEESLSNMEVGSTIEEKWSSLKACLLSATDSTCGWTKGPPRRKETWWWNDQVDLAVKAIGGVRGQKNKLSLSERSYWFGFSAFYGMKKSLSVPKILTIKFFGPLSFL